jgi:hypothetical protein
MPDVRHAFGDERAATDACFREAALSRFGIGARDGGEVDAERFRQRAMGR